MFNLADVLAQFRRAKRPDRTPTQKYSAEARGGRTSDQTRQDFETWQRHWEGIQRGIDELVAHLRQESRP
jgi:hypothetical protein